MRKAEEHHSSIIENLLNNISDTDKLKVEKRMALAAIIDEAIKAKGWKKKDLAEALHINNSSVITRWLSGTHNFTVDTLSDIERVLDIQLLNIDLKLKPQNVSINITVSKVNDDIHLNQYNDLSYYQDFLTKNGITANKTQYQS
jgi:ribosome-binding protein aMBF1 (putative translation factor)